MISWHSKSSGNGNGATAKPVRLILDTDMGNDIDDALALAMIHALESRNECRLIGVTVSKDNAFAPVFVDVVNTFYGRGNVPIGMVRDGVTPGERTFLRPITLARDNGHFRFPRTRTTGDYPDAVNTLRRLLAAEHNRSVVIVMIGFSTNLARLLDSAPDEISPLSGTQLLATKVARVIAMAGDFSAAVQAQPTLENREYNIHQDIASGARFFHDCPCPVVFSGYEVGLSVLFPARSIVEDYRWATDHPVAEAYRQYMPMPYDRPTWDLTAVLDAVRPDAGYFDLSEPGRVTICDEGTARFAAESNGPHRFLLLKQDQRDRLLDDMIRLCAQPSDTFARRQPFVEINTCARCNTDSGKAHKELIP